MSDFGVSVPPDRDGIRARLDAATPGPWECRTRWTESTIEAPGRRIATVNRYNNDPDELRHATAEFIAAAPSDIRALLAALDAAEARERELREAIGDWLDAKEHHRRCGVCLGHSPSWDGHNQRPLCIGGAEEQIVKVAIGHVATGHLSQISEAGHVV